MSEGFFAHAALEGEARYQRMEQTSRLVAARLQPLPPRHKCEPLALVGYGPTLNQTWQEVAQYRHVMSMSGSHDFLVERGVIPTWHVEYDPRPHKTAFHTKPTKTTVYLISSTCDPALIAMLPPERSVLWHGLGPDQQADVERIKALEPKGLLCGGGTNVGLRAFAVGYTLGFRSFDIFGMDCSYADGENWAGKHSGIPHQMLPVRCNGKEFLSSGIMLDSADEWWRLLFHSKVDLTFNVFGDHLFAERLRLARHDPELANTPVEWWEPIGWERQQVDDKTGEELDGGEDTPLISASYRRLNRALHLSNAEFGTVGQHYLKRVKAFDTKDILDYGCGKRTLEMALGFTIKNYDPAITGCDSEPEPAQLVVCTDVLEHVEADRIDAVIAHLRGLTKKQALIAVSLVPANKHLGDGSNTHKIIKPREWWMEKLSAFFTVEIVEETAMNLLLIAKPKGRGNGLER